MKILVGMSGGVDSSVAAYLLQQAGYDCLGATMTLCRGLPGVLSQDTADAQAVADRLNIPFCVLEADRAFRNCVVDPFVDAYESGLTPNPCIECNRHLKFRVMLDRAMEMGCDGIATGHYAIIRKDENTGRFRLFKAVDHQKDQSYFLACLTQEQLSRTHLPLGAYTKEEIREIAVAQGFVNARRKDSQDICFIPDGDYVRFLKEYTQKTYPPGTFCDLDGKVVGRHNGAVAYTIGQRKGLGIALGEPVYVCSKNMRNNTVTIGPDSALFRQAFIADDWNWLPFPQLNEPMEVDAKIRYRHTPQPATVYPQEDGTCKVVFKNSQRAITPGQTAVLYLGDEVIGCGKIRTVL